MKKAGLSIVIVFLLFARSLVIAEQVDVDSLLRQIENAGDLQKTEIYNQLSSYYFYNDPQKTIEYGKKALNLAKQNSYKEDYFFALINIGIGYSILGNNNKAVEYHLLGVEKAKEIKKPSLMAKAHSDLGIDYQLLGDYDKSLENLLKALSIREERLLNGTLVGTQKEIANSLNNVGAIYDETGNFAKAEEYYSKSLEISKTIDDEKGVARAMHNLGVFYKERGEYEKALEFYNRALIIKSKIGNERSTAMTIGNIGIVHLDLKDYDSALYYHFEALEIYKKLNDLYGFANYSNSIAEIYLDMGKPHSAYPYILDGLKFSKEINAKKLLSDSYWFLAKYYSETNEHQKAYETQKTLIYLKDSLLNQEMAEKIAEMQTRYEVDKKEQEIHLLTKDNEIQTLKIKKQSVQLYFLIAFILLIAIVTILMFNRYHLKQKHYHVELEKKNLETEQRLLRSQMNPHFIFNSMNSIQSYISGNDNFTAMTYLSKFAQLMRGILENSREAMISLEEEINTLILYIELEQLRFKNKFDYKLEFDPEIYPETTYIPPMLVQPFVENAIKHGLRNKDGNGLLKIGFKKRDRLIECTIEDNGIGRELAKTMNEMRNKDHQSLGMQVTHERIDAFKKDKNANSNLKIIDLKNKEGKASGTLVNVLFPYEEE